MTLRYWTNCKILPLEGLELYCHHIGQQMYRWQIAMIRSDFFCISKDKHETKLLNMEQHFSVWGREICGKFLIVDDKWKQFSRRTNGCPAKRTPGAQP